LAIQAAELYRILRTRCSEQLRYLLAFTLLEFILVIARVVVAATQVNPVLNINEVPFSMLAVLVAALGVNVLSYLTMVGFWSERAVTRRKMLEVENERVAHLLNEREALIGSLMLANKSSAAGAMSASLAHEINQPIASSRINLFTLRRYLSNKETNPEEIEQLLAHMEFDNQRAGDIVATLRSIFNQQEFSIQNIPLVKAIESTVGLARGELSMAAINLQIDIPDGLLVQANMVELQQVLLNLLNNAIDALRKVDSNVKTICISAKQNTENLVELKVQDNGPGVPSEFVKTMFDLFATQKKTGMGVGLWLCQHILSRWGGSIRYEPGQIGGSIFIVTMKGAD
jgi:C4-dicarboxylate-specific signal transduction histidine kinase